MNRQRWFAVGLGSAMLFAGVSGFTLMSSLREPPAEASTPSGANALAVQTVAIEPTDYTVSIDGYGEVRSIRSVEMASEVSGTVVETHPRFVAGGVVQAGEILFALDPRPYEAAAEQARARVAHWEAQVSRLQAELEATRQRTQPLERSVELARARYERAKELHKQSIGNQTDVDAAERDYNAAVDTLAQVKQALASYPMTIEESRQQLAEEQAGLKHALLDLEYTKIKAPFDGHITGVFVETGQYVSRGQRTVRIADDSVLEIPVKLDAQEARAWLRFDDDAKQNGMAWFAQVEPVTCTVRWVEQPERARWQGRLDRVERIDPETRTVTAVVRLAAKDALACKEGPPLVAGMFCEVTIPGRVLTDVFAVPRNAVNVDGSVYLADDGRLQTVPVTIARTEGDVALVRDGLHTGDRVITTRLINPIDNTPLDVENTAAASKE